MKETINITTSEKNEENTPFKTTLQLLFNKEAHTCRLVWHGRPYKLASST